VPNSRREGPYLKKARVGGCACVRVNACANTRVHTRGRAEVRVRAHARLPTALPGAAPS